MLKILVLASSKTPGYLDLWKLQLMKLATCKCILQYLNKLLMHKLCSLPGLSLLVNFRLGANHDESTSGCSKSGFIMDGSGGVGDIRQFFFSNCTDGLISSFVRSSDAACLGRIDEPQSPSIAPGFNTVPAPSIVEQCRKRLNNSNAYVTDKDTGNCTMATCWIQQSAGHSSGIIFTPVDNSPCLGGGVSCHSNR